MCPKAKSDRVVTHRIEFQQTERDALEMVAASIAARNVTASVGNLISPILGASVAGVAAMLGLIAWWEIEQGDSLARKSAGTNPNTGKQYTREEIANAIPGPHSSYTDPSKPGGEPSTTSKIGEQIENKLQAFSNWIRNNDTSGLL